LAVINHLAINFLGSECEKVERAVRQNEKGERDLR
jgi:hypothetical protein